MSSPIEKKFYKLQAKTTRALVGQQVFLSEQEQTDDFLDRINLAKAENKELISDYKLAIENVVVYIENSKTTEQLVSISEIIKNLVGTTKRLIKSLGEGKTSNCYLQQISEYKILLNDINEILEDINYRINGYREMLTLLDSL